MADDSDAPPPPSADRPPSGKPPIGAPLPGWQARPYPPRTAMEGTRVTVEPLDPDRHARALFAANALDGDDRNWTYLPYGPFREPEAYRAWMEGVVAKRDPFFHAVVENATGRAVGVASLMEIREATGVIEIGHINFSPLLQRTPASTEAIRLMLGRVFDELGYRRCEWKCDSLNAPSRAAARRFGFRFEGIFRQATIYKGRNRDTAWFSIIDKDWPFLKMVFDHWLAPDNFDADGQQRTSLSKLTAKAMTAVWSQRHKG